MLPTKLANHDSSQPAPFLLLRSRRALGRIFLRLLTKVAASRLFGLPADADLLYGPILRQLLSERSQVRRLLEQLSDGVLIQQNGQIAFANQTLARLLETTREDLVGKSVYDIADVRSHAEIRTRMTNLIEKKIVATTPTELFLRSSKSHQLQPVETVTVQVNFEGHPSFVTILRDLRDRKKMQDQLILSDRMTSLGRLAAGVGHEISNPLAYVLLKLELLRIGLHKEQETKHHQELIEIERGLEKIRLIVGDLKKFSLDDLDEISQPVDLASVLRTAVNMTRRQIEAKARLRVEILQSPKVEGSDARICQVLLNLLSNAAQAIESGHVETNVIEVRLVVDDARQAVITVRDTGCGIATENQAKIFDPFFTTKAKVGGTGLGLSICRSLVTQFGGSLDFESRAFEGALFRLTFPVLSHGPELAKPTEAPSPLTSGRRKRVLVIDDNRDLGHCLRELLSLSHDTTFAATVAEAVEIINSQPAFDCILCDLQMPAQDGLDFYRILTDQRPGDVKKLVFMSGASLGLKFQHTDGRAKVRAIEKPIQIKKLHALIAENLD